MWKQHIVLIIIKIHRPIAFTSTIVQTMHKERTKKRDTDQQSYSYIHRVGKHCHQVTIRCSHNGIGQWLILTARWQCLKSLSSYSAIPYALYGLFSTRCFKSRKFLNRSEHPLGYISLFIKSPHVPCCTASTVVPPALCISGYYLEHIPRRNNSQSTSWENVSNGTFENFHDLM